MLGGAPVKPALCCRGTGLSGSGERCGVKAWGRALLWLCQGLAMLP